MAELFRSDFLTVSQEGDLVTLSWARDEPGDEHAQATARQVVAALDAHLKAHPGLRVRVLADRTRVKGNYPRAITVYTGWMLQHRNAFRAAAFATGNFLLRAGLKVATMVPGTVVKGFDDVEEARRFLQRLE